MRISALGNKLLQDNTLDNKTFESQPDKTAAVVGLGVNLITLLSAILRPFMPSTADAIATQIHLSDTLLIPEKWAADALKSGHKIGTAQRLFSQIPAEKETEWREQFGGEEVKKFKEEQRLKAEKKRLDKERKKAKKAAKSSGEGPALAPPEAKVEKTDDVQEIAKKVEDLRT
jgi:methionyl-tRNA synthetase